MLNRFLPSFIKSIIRFFYYPQERARIFRELKIVTIQNERIKQYNKEAKRVIFFLIPGADFFTGSDRISGGIISIVSLCEESNRLRDIHGAEVILCTFPGENLLIKHTQFKNETDVLRYSQFPNYFGDAEHILVHLPEYLCNHFLHQYETGRFEWLKQLKSVHINILNQSIMLMPSVENIAKLKAVFSVVTATTAHQRYCSRQYRDLYKIPLHKFSVWISPEKYIFRNYNQKENLIIVSPDEHALKDVILSKLQKIPNLTIQIIQNLTYEEYKKTISRAKWSLTFGEGLDGYLIEPIFSGAIGFGVYNDDFFTEDFKQCYTIYESIDQLEDEIVNDMQSLENEIVFEKYQHEQFALCAKYYSESEYKRNIASFYKGEYTYV